MLVKLTRNLIKSLHIRKDDNDGFTDLENELVNGCRVINKSYVENGPSFVLKLDGQVEPVTISRDLLKSLHARGVIRISTQPRQKYKILTGRKNRFL